MITYMGIDGTSSEKGTASNPGDYQNTFRNSFVHRLARNELVKFTKPGYLRGPYTDGFDTRERAEAGYNWVVEKWQSGEAKAIFLAGYSRGGAAVIEIAKWLKERENIPVECLILFDPVDRTGTLGEWFGETPIVSTVKYVVQPTRDYERTWSRWTFQKCGNNVENSAATFRWRQQFLATHGGLGGTPWETATNPYTGEPHETIWEWGEGWATKLTPTQDRDGATAVEGFAFPLIGNVYRNCMARLAAGEPDFQVPLPPRRGGSYIPPRGGSYVPSLPRVGNQRIHVVKAGDWLSKIAITYYGDMNKWKIIYEVPENKAVIGANPDLIKPGQRLIIP